MNQVRRKALELLRSAFFFCRFLADARRAGLVGEKRNAQVVYVIAVSRLLSRPLSLFVKGPSSVGKNWLTDTVLRFIPRSEVRKLTGSSQKSWNYQGRNLAHKVVYLKERNDAAGPVHPLRLLISEQELTYYVTVREGGKSVVKKYVTKGPIAAVSTTTKDRVEVDDETRHLSIWLDESAEQTARIINASLQREMHGTPELSQEELEAWHEVQRLLRKRAPFPLSFPCWFDQVSQFVHKESLWTRRYFPAFLQALRAVTLIRSFRWHKKELQRKGGIPLTFNDLAIAAFIFEPVFAESLGRAEDRDVETRQAIERLSAMKSGRPVGAVELAKELSISSDKAYSLLRRALNAGTVYRVNPPTKGNLKLYLPAPLRRFLPEPAEMFQRLEGGPRRVKFVHPLTGEWVVYKR